MEELLRKWSHWRMARLAAYWFARETMWSSMQVILVPLLVSQLVGDQNKGLALGAMSIGSTALSMIGYAFLGHVSDLTPRAKHSILLPYGKRLPYLAIGMVLVVPVLCAHALFGLSGKSWLVYCLLMVAQVAMVAGDLTCACPLSAIVPDIVPVSQYGAVAGWVGLAKAVGTLLGAGLVGVVVTYLRIFGSFFILVFLYIVCSAVALTVGEHVENTFELQELGHEHGGDKSTGDVSVVLGSSSDDEKSTENVAGEGEDSDEMLTEAVSLPLDDEGTAATLVENVESSLDKEPAILQPNLTSDQAKADDAESAATYGSEDTCVIDVAAEEWAPADIPLLEEEDCLDTSVEYESTGLLGLLRHLHASVDVCTFLGLVIEPFYHSNFRWVYIQRLLYTAGFSIPMTFFLYFIDDTGAAKDIGLDAVTATGIAVGFMTVTSVFSASLGCLSDRFGRKTVLYFAMSFMAASPIGMALFPFYPLIVVGSVVFGFGYGSFISVDYALASDVLPSTTSHALDLGIWHSSWVAPLVFVPGVAGWVRDLLENSAIGADSGPLKHPGYLLIMAISSSALVVSTIALCFIRDTKQDAYLKDKRSSSQGQPLEE